MKETVHGQLTNFVVTSHFGGIFCISKTLIKLLCKCTNIVAIATAKVIHSLVKMVSPKVGN